MKAYQVVYFLIPFVINIASFWCNKSLAFYNEPIYELHE